MKNIRDIISAEAVPYTIEPNKCRDQYFEVVGMNPSSLASGLVGTNDVDPCQVKLAWESPDQIVRTIASQDSLNRGTLAHLMMLQPELVADRVVIWRGGRRSGNEYSEFEEENSGKLLITAADNVNVMRATNKMRSLPEVASLLNGIDCEVAMLGSERCGTLDGHIIVKGQVDGVNHGTNTIVDLKTTEAGIDQRSVERTIRNFHYREKMAMYRRWLAKATKTEQEIWKCYNIFMSLKEPYGVVIVKFTTDSLEWGADRMLASLQGVEKCLAANNWPVFCRSIFMGVEIWEMDDDEGDVNYDN